MSSDASVTQDGPVALTVSQVAQQMAVSHPTVLRWVRSGDLPAIRVGRIVRIPTDAFDAFIAARTSGN